MNLAFLSLTKTIAYVPLTIAGPGPRGWRPRRVYLVRMEFSVRAIPPSILEYHRAPFLTGFCHWKAICRATRCCCRPASWPPSPTRSTGRQAGRQAPRTPQARAHESPRLARLPAAAQDQLRHHHHARGNEINATTRVKISDLVRIWTYALKSSDFGQIFPSRINTETIA